MLLQSPLRNNGNQGQHAIIQNKYKNTFVGVLRTHITFVTHSSPSCYVTLRTQVIRLNSGNLGPQKTDSGVFIIISRPEDTPFTRTFIVQYNHHAMVHITIHLIPSLKLFRSRTKFLDQDHELDRDPDYVVPCKRGI